ncbi:hypothetical protein ACN6MT_21055 [Neobacillus niacini]|uniref:hypothetical protein n=1 Tax=Neobacillus niacini TaxID=86668 RepID=UPI003B01B1BB
MNMNTQLILLEGLPGSGKSTNSRIIMSHLDQLGKKVRWFHEVARPHPTLFFHEANLTLYEYEEFCGKFPNIKGILDSISIVMKDSISIDLLELEWNHQTVGNKEAINAIKEYDVWNYSLQKYIPIAIEKWRHFVKGVKTEKDYVVILDSSIFQFQIYTFLERNTPFEDLEHFVTQLFSIIAELNPALIYIYRENVENAIINIEESRGIEFLERIWERDSHQPYYQNRPSGAEGYREFLRDYDKWSKQLFELTPFKKLGVEVSNKDWGKYISEILSFLEIEKVNKQKAIYPKGKYVNTLLNLKIEIQEGNFIDPSGKKKALIPRSPNEFYIEDVPTILRHEGPNKIIIKDGQLIERWTKINTEFIKV